MDTNNIALSLESLTKIYSTRLKAVDNISLEVKKGDFFALLGPNGAGKSTILSMISSLVNITEGKIKIYGHDVQKNYIQARKMLGVMPQEININAFRSPVQILRLQGGYFGMKKKNIEYNLEKLLNDMELWDKRNTEGRLLSGGMKRRLMVARALIHNPKVLILDEPTAGVDIQLRLSLWNLIRKLNEDGMTVILTTHYLEEAEALCNKIALINKGMICIDTDMKSLLKTIEKEKYIIELNTPYPKKGLTVPEGEGISQDPMTIEFTLNKNASLNSLFESLTKKNIEVHSIKPYKTRLEQLFLDIINDNK
ncbi:MAG: ABC transporter ATP-binding protein [bacterium]|nr:ABC transporter ATP-binding protein [bacterium]